MYKLLQFSFTVTSFFLSTIFSPGARAAVHVHVLVTGLTSFTGFGVCCDQARHYAGPLFVAEGGVGGWGACQLAKHVAH